MFLFSNFLNFFQIYQFIYSKIIPSPFSACNKNSKYHSNKTTQEGMKTIFKKKKKLDAEFQFILLRYDNSNNFPRQGGNSIESGQRPRMEKSRWARKVDVLIRLLWVSRRIVSGSRYGEASSTLIAISPFNEAPGRFENRRGGIYGRQPAARVNPRKSWYRVSRLPVSG